MPVSVETKCQSPENSWVVSEASNFMFTTDDLTPLVK